MSSVNSACVSPSMSPSGAPKFGTRVPNRVFVGGISSNTTENELFELFSTYGEVRATKIIADRAGVSKGYGFVTFATEEEAESILKQDNVTLNDRKLNVAPAVRKQPFSRYFGSQDVGSDTTGSSSRMTPRATPEFNLTSPEPAQILSNGTVFYHNGTPYVYPNGGLIFAAAAPDGTCQYSQPAHVSEAYYPVMYSPTLYIPQQQPYQYPPPATAQSQWTGQQLRWAAQVNYGQSPSPQANAASTHHYVYTSNGNSNSASAVTSAGSSTPNLVPVQQQPKGAGGDTNGCQPAVSYTAAYAYTPLSQQHIPQNTYQQIMTTPPQTQDYAEQPLMIESVSAEPPPNILSQDSTTTTDSRVTHIARQTSNRFVRPPACHYQSGCQTSETNYRPMQPLFEQSSNNNNNSNGRGYQRNRGRCGGGSGNGGSGSYNNHTSPQHHHLHQHQQHQQHQQQQQQQQQHDRPRFHYKSMAYNESLNAQGKCPLTPPATPMAGDGPTSSSSLSLSDSNTLSDTTKKMEALSI